MIRNQELILRRLRHFCHDSPAYPLLVIGVGLLAQCALEFLRDRAWIGVVLYLIAASGLLWAAYRDQWSLAPWPAPAEGGDPRTVRLAPFAMALLLAFAAFLTFGGNRFTLLNLTLWWSSLTLYLWALEVRRPTPSPLWKLRDLLCHPGVSLHLSQWHLAVLLTAALVLSFAFYLLNVLPPQPSVDHAENVEDMLTILDGQWSIFFPRNTGREPLIMYWTVIVASLFRTPLSFHILKLSTVLIGIFNLPYLYLLGKEAGNRRVGLLTALFFGIAAWPTILSHFGLRMVFHPFFTTVVLYYLMRGLRTAQRNDFLLTGLGLGLGLYGYTAFRVVPLVVLLGLGLYILHVRDLRRRQDALIWMALVLLTALIVFLPLLRYAVEYPASFFYRTFARVGSWERALPGPWLPILVSNLWKAPLMFNWDSGQVWILFVPGRPALDAVAGALFLLGGVLLLWRYLREHHWQDLFLLLALLVLLLPSALSISFPGEHPHVSRAGGAAPIAFLIVALAMDSFLTVLERHGRSPWARWASVLLVLSSLIHNSRILYQYEEQYRLKMWNSCDYGAVIQRWKDHPVPLSSIWVVPYPDWVDTRLPGLCIGFPDHDFGLPPDRIPDTARIPGPKLFILAHQDRTSLQKLESLYPCGISWQYPSRTPGYDLRIFLAPY